VRVAYCEEYTGEYYRDGSGDDFAVDYCWNKLSLDRDVVEPGENERYCTTSHYDRIEFSQSFAFFWNKMLFALKVLPFGFGPFFSCLTQYVT